MRIETVVKDGLCTSCGICAGVCPKNCIKSEYHGGSYLPMIDESECVNCGLCHDVCPGKGADYVKIYETISELIPDEIMVGNFKKCLVAQAKDEDVLHKSTSGAVVTTLVSNLLHDGVYDSAFLLDTYDYSKQIFTQRYTKDMNLENTPKSRYLTVNHSQAVKYILKNKNERIILVGTPCFLQGFLQIVNHFNLNRNNYLLLGIFCDKNFNYNMWNYFKSVFEINHNGTTNKLKHLYFRDKDKGSWPGNVILENTKNKWLLPAKSRMLMKEYFCLERCLYCIDKLNQFADISCGDNYTKGQYKSSKLGSSNLIIRTELGDNIMKRYSDKFNIDDILINEILTSQHVNVRKDNYVYSLYKSSEIGYTFNNLPPKAACTMCEELGHKQKYKTLLQKLHMGQNEDFPALAADMCLRVVLPYKFILNVTDELLDKKIVMYGAGGVGYDYYRQLYDYARCQVVAWVDSNYSKFKYKEGTVQPVEDIKSLDYDLILIAVRDKKVAEEIKNSLADNGVDREKLYWIAPVCL